MRNLSRRQVRQIDRCAIEQIGLPGVVLMENAGRQVADAVERFLARPGAAIAIVAGAGNNGGDGFVVARHLSLRGFSTVTFLVASAEKVGGDAAVNLRALGKLGGDVREVRGEELACLAGELRRFDAIVDAVGGTGIEGAIRGDAAAAVEQINAAGRPVIAIDIPTGLDCDTGRAEGPCVRADLTVTFVARKKGFDATGAAEYAGQVIVADIGVPPDVVARLAAYPLRPENAFPSRPGPV